MHDLDEMSDGIGRILGTALSFEPAVDEELEEIEGQHPDREDRQECVGGMVEDMVEVPVGDPLIEACVFDVPPGP